MMKRIFFVRHGIYEQKPGQETILSAEGTQQMIDIASTITSPDNGTTIIVSSPMSWAKESAELIAAQLGGIPIRYADEVMWFGPKNIGALSKKGLSAIERIRKDTDADTVIVVTHRDEAYHIARCAAKKHHTGDWETFFKNLDGLGNGDAFEIDMENNSIAYHISQIREKQQQEQ